MAQTRTRRRGSYAKGVAKREEILTRALDVIAREGYGGASVKELAAAVGLSQAGLLHYFDSKEELFTAILRKRDEVDMGASSRAQLGRSRLDDLRAGYLRVVRHNAQVPGMVELYSRMAVDAADPTHPAHDFFTERGRDLRRIFADAVERDLPAEAPGRRADSAMIARILQAVTDGLQLQWMLEPDFDMSAVIDALFTVVGSGDHDRDRTETTAVTEER